MASIGIGIGIVKMSAKLLVLVLVLLRRFPKVLVLVLGRNFGIGQLCYTDYRQYKNESCADSNLSCRQLNTL